MGSSVRIRYSPLNGDAERRAQRVNPFLEENGYSADSLEFFDMVETGHIGEKRAALFWGREKTKNQT